MANPYADLRALSVQRSEWGGSPLRPPRRWLTRRLLPAVLLGCFAALIVWASWDLLIPVTPVTVTPVVARKGIVEAGGVELFKAIGWIEPSPTPIEVTALAEGIVQELNVRPSDRVRPGDVIAKLVDTDAKLALEATRLKVRAAKAELAAAEADLRAAEILVQREQAQVQKSVLFKIREETVIQRDSAQAKVDLMKVRVEEAELAEREAQLRLDRMTVRSPAAGVVMRINTLPGRMAGSRQLAAQFTAGQQHEGLVTLYDPERLQVYVNVPDDKFRFVRPNQPVQLEVDALSGRRLVGRVLYDTHQTDKQTKTVQVKVELIQYPASAFALPYYLSPHSPARGTMLMFGEGLKSLIGPQPNLRPDMPVSPVRFMAPATGAKEVGGEVLRIFVPRKLVVSEGGQAQVWIVDQAAGRASLRPVVVGQPTFGDMVEVVQGLQPSDRLITTGRELLKPGERVRVVSEETISTER